MAVRIYELNDVEWWIASSLEEAMQDYQDPGGDPDLIGDAHELTDADLDRLKYYPDPYSSDKWVTFRQQLEQCIAAGVTLGCFAIRLSEY